MAQSLKRFVIHTRSSPSAPLALLAVVSVLSLGARLAWLDDPCRSPCKTAADHTLIFDETYYVNAARVIAGVRPPSGAPYAGAPAGVDPNSEHPQLAKLVIAASIELFGDGPLAWRLGSVVLGSIAILGMFALVRAAGGGRWQALGASALMAADNLLLVHSRIGTLDVYVLAAMLWGVALYLRGRPLAAGVTLGIGACAKLVAPYALLVIGLLEALRFLLAHRGVESYSLRALARRIGLCVASAVGVFFGLLAVLDRLAPPYDPNANTRLSGGPFGHFAHMLSYSAAQTSPHGPRGIASYPWQWFGDYKPIVYLNIDPSSPTRGLNHIHPAVHFLGVVSPPILLLGLPGLLVAAYTVSRARASGLGAAGAASAAGADGVPLLALAWFAGTWLPFELLSLLVDRTSYLYYMVIVMPGLYLAAVHLVARWRPRTWVLVGWGALVIAAAIVMYPLTPLP
jgi:4-amino-4-deoxy-L-arabinose transferase-like glycosyltransferase